MTTETSQRTPGVARRTLFRVAAGVAASALAAPLVARHSLASSGEVRVFAWSGYFTDAMLADFEKATGIKAIYTPFGTNDEQLNQLRATRGEGFDIIMPTVDRVPNYLELDYLQAVDPRKVEMDRIIPSAIAGATQNGGAKGGTSYFVPTHWGTEALAFDTRTVKLEYGKASLGDLWDPAYRGKVTVRGHSGLAGVGRWLEAQGRLPHPFRDSFLDEAKMRANYDAIVKTAIENKPAIGQFWTNANDSVGAFQANGCVIGQTWDATAVALKKAGVPATYMAPKEGAFAWLEGYCLLKAAKNVEQSYAWINHFLKPEVGAQFASAQGSNAVAKGAENHLDADAKAFFQAAYPGDALERLWWWPVQDSWFVTRRNEYQDRYLAA